LGLPRFPYPAKEAEADRNDYTDATEDNEPDGYVLGSYRIATAPESNSSRLTSFKSTYLDSAAGKPQALPFA